MNPEEKRSSLSFKWIVPLTILLLSFIVWDFYLKAGQTICGESFGYLYVFFGFLLSGAIGFWIRAREYQEKVLKDAFHEKRKQLSQKLEDAKNSDRATSCIYQCCQELHTSISLDEVLSHVMNIIKKGLGADDGSVMLLGSDNILTIAASSGIPEEIARTVRLKLGERVAGRAALLRKEFLLIEGLENYPDFRGIQSNPRIHSSIICPMIAHCELVGVLTLNRTKKKENFTVSDLMHASIMASEIAQAIQNTRLHDVLHHKSDELEAASRMILELKEKIRED